MAKMILTTPNQINTKSGEEVIQCASCNNDSFIQGYKLNKVSALVTANGKPQIAADQIFICAKCNTNVNIMDMLQLTN